MLQLNVRTMVNFIKRLVSLMLLLKLLKIIDKLLVRQLIKKEENYEKDNYIVLASTDVDRPGWSRIGDGVRCYRENIGRGL